MPPICTQCQTPNADNRAFCAECGRPLLKTCTDCQFDNEPAAKFCGGCGRRLEDGTASANAPGQDREPAAPPVAIPAVGGGIEKRHLTVMFCDLVDSTALTARLDPEDMRAINRAFQETCTETIERYGGYVARYLGDGILAYFGYPHAHEDDAERSVNAGLDLIEGTGALSDRWPDLLSSKLGVRIGIASGEVVSGDLVGEGAARESTVVGQTPNLAARLEQLAPTNGLVVADATRQLLGRRFAYEDLGEQTLKGFDTAQHAWRVTARNAARSRFDVRHQAELTPLVGRSLETAAMQERLSLTRAGEGQVILISGEPGIGKSRLCQSLLGEAHTAASKSYIFQCAPYHRNTALYPVVQQLREELSARGEQSAADGPGIHGALEALGLPDTHRDVLVQLLEYHDKAGDEPPEEHQRRLLEALSYLTATRAQRGPLIMLFEDVHWMDPTSLQYLSRLVDQVRDLPILVIATFRPEFVPPWIGQAHVLLLALSRMSHRQSADIVARIVGDSLPARVVEQLVARTDGIPLFLEELTRTVMESAAAETDGDDTHAPRKDFSVPESLRDSLMERLDQVPEIKWITQVASVIGREFSLDCLDAITEESRAQVLKAVDQLMEKQLVFPAGNAADRYIFKHALLRDTAYDSLLRDQKKALHLRLADVLEQRMSETSDFDLELVAQHYTAAGVTDKAIHYWERAARMATERFANEEATNHLNQALALLPGDDSKGGRQRELDLRKQLVGCFRLLGRYQEALASLDLAEGIAEGSDNLFALSGIHHDRGNIFFTQGNISGCLAQHRQALDFALRSGSKELEARAIGGMGDGFYSQGRMTSALESFERCCEISRDQGFLAIDAANRPMLGWTRNYQLEYQRAIDDTLSAREVAARAGHERGEMMSLAALSVLRTHMGDFSQAIVDSEASQEISDKLGTEHYKAAILHYRAETYFRMHQTEAAVPLLESALQLSEAYGMQFVGPSVLGLKALLCEDPDDWAKLVKEGERLLDQGCVGHNYFWFLAYAIDGALKHRLWAEVERLVRRLEIYTREEALPWSNLIIARGRALAHWGTDPGPPAHEALTRIRDRATECHYHALVPVIDDALSGNA